ncbi:hypothetical protein GJ496_001968 [Pomphorhynchus laevis]|nr:hypothetical protein GJ496_001968 [Pomphorhynchus laevis]
MDNLFRFEKLISRTHEVFTNSLIYTSDKEYLPQWESGFEGLRQRGWTIVTVATIRLVSKETKIPIKIMGQGDNPIQDSIMSQSGLQPFDIELPLVNGEPTLGIQAVVDMPPNGDIRFTILINTTAEDAATCAACSVFRYCQAPGTRVEPRAQQLLQTENDGSSRRCHKARHRPCNTTKNGQTPSYAPRSRGRRLRIFGGLLQCYNQEQGTL